MTVLIAIGVTLDFVGYMISNLDMLLGMRSSMSTASIMNMALKRLRTERIVIRMIEIVQLLVNKHRQEKRSVFPKLKMLIIT